MILLYSHCMSAKLKAVFVDFATMGPDIDTSPLERVADVSYHDISLPEDIPQRLASAEVAIVNKAKITAEMMTQARQLRLIVVSATGTDNVDLEAAGKRGIRVANIRNYCNASVVQHVFALVLSLTQQVHRYDELVRTGAWARSPTFALFDYPIQELAGRNLGIVGYGSLGQAVGEFGRCMGMRLLISARPGTAREAIPNGRQAFEDVVVAADVLSLHCPLTVQTKHLIGRRELAAMKSSAILVNTARGGLVDSEALVESLERGEIAGAGIDVLSQEPPRENDVLVAANLPNLIVTPHISWAAREARQRALTQIAENIAEFASGRELSRAV